MFNNTSNYHLSLLASSEIWAKMFIEKKSVSEVNELVKANYGFAE